MQFSLLIQSSPDQSITSQNAIAFAQAVVGSGHSLFRVFFQGDGTLHGFSRPSTEIAEDWAGQWQQLTTEHGVDLVICVSGADERGLDKGDLLAGFELSGLGQLVEASSASDRLVTFG